MFKIDVKCKINVCLIDIYIGTHLLLVDSESFMTLNIEDRVCVIIKEKRLCGHTSHIQDH